jgi:RHS repeat-associated protein
MSLVGSLVVVLNNSVALIGSQLYGPYGNSRYSAGTLPTSIGFTGQQTDSVTGLDYFHARYYDPLTGQFLSADVVQGNARGTSPYRYVMGNPETRTDPTGERMCVPTGDGGTECAKPGGGTYCYSGDCSGGGSSGGNSDGNNNNNRNNKNNNGCLWKGKACSATNNPCGGGTVWGGTAKGCVSDPREQLRQQKLAALHTKADWELLAGYILFLAGDALSFVKGDALDKLDAILDFITTLVNSIVPLIGDLIGGEAYHIALSISSWAMHGLGIIQTAIAVIRSENWFLKHWADAVADLVTATVAGPGAIMMSIVMQAVKPVVGYLIDAGGHFLQGLGFADLAEEARERNMSIQDWCATDGGCPAV